MSILCNTNPNAFEQIFSFLFFFSLKTKVKLVISLGLGKVEHLAQHFYYTALPPCLWLKLLDKF